MMNTLKGYWNIRQAVYWARTVRCDHPAMAEGTNAEPFNGANSGLNAVHAVEEALQCGELSAAGIRESDGELVAIPSAAWRASFARQGDPLGVVVSGGFDTPHTDGPPPKTRFPFQEANRGRTILVSDQWVTPIIARADLARWAGEEPPAEPPERPDGWPEPSARAEPPIMAKPDKNVVLAAATGIARKLHAQDGRKPTQGQVVEGLAKDGYGPMESKEAAANLPAEFKRRRGEHNNKIASDAHTEPKATAAKRPNA